MGSPLEALKQREIEQQKARKLNKKLGLRRGQKVKVFGQVYLQPGFEEGGGRLAEILDLNYPTTARVRFIDTLKEAYADKKKLKPLKRNKNGTTRKP